jgi:hypothetical protein
MQVAGVHAQHHRARALQGGLDLLRVGPELGLEKNISP